MTLQPAENSACTAAEHDAAREHGFAGLALAMPESNQREVFTHGFTPRDLSAPHVPWRTQLFLLGLPMRLAWRATVMMNALFATLRARTEEEGQSRQARGTAAGTRAPCGL